MLLSQEIAEAIAPLADGRRIAWEEDGLSQCEV